MTRSEIKKNLQTIKNDADDLAMLAKAFTRILTSKQKEEKKFLEMLCELEQVFIW